MSDPLNLAYPEIYVRITALAQRALAADGQPPFSEQSLLTLRRGSSNMYVATVPAGKLPQEADYSGHTVPRYAAAGLCYLPAESADHLLLELVVDPEHRGQGLGTQLLQELLEWAQQHYPGHGIDAWAHGNHPAATVLAERFSFHSMRELLRLSWNPQAQLPASELPEGIHLRTFRADSPTDLAALHKANALAFAQHPEQGALTLADFRARVAESWFDPEGLFFALRTSPENNQEVLGFAWTKWEKSSKPSGPGQSNADQPDSKEHVPAPAELYVVGITPAAQGMGLGKALTLASLQYLQGKDAPQVLLYVDADNLPARKLYESLGFILDTTDVQYHRSH